MTEFNDGHIFEHKGRTFVLTIEADEDHGAPWDNEDGHGVVDTRKTCRRNGYDVKSAGERVLMNNGFQTTFYDMAATVKIAQRDGWSFGGKSVAEWQAEGLSLKAIAAKAAEADFKHLSDWVNGHWCYVGAVVTLTDDDGETPRPLYRESLWGIENDAGDYFEEVARELADEILRRMG